MEGGEDAQALAALPEAMAGSTTYANPSSRGDEREAVPSSKAEAPTTLPVAAATCSAQIGEEEGYSSAAHPGVPEFMAARAGGLSGDQGRRMAKGEMAQGGGSSQWRVWKGMTGSSERRIEKGRALRDGNRCFFCVGIFDGICLYWVQDSSAGNFGDIVAGDKRPDLGLQSQ